MDKTQTRKGLKMTDAEVLRQVHEDIRHLTEKLDRYIDDNHKSHMEIQKQLSEVDKKHSITGTKLGLLAGGIAIIATGIINAGMRYL